MRLLIAGVSTRAAAESAARAGFEVTAIDAFGDRDQHPAVRSFSMPRHFSARPTAAAIARASRSLECEAVAYLSPFENHPRSVAALAAGRTLLGNPPDVLRRVRDPIQLANAFRERGFAVPEVRLPASAKATGGSAEAFGEGGKPDPTDQDVASGFSRTQQWLIKPLKSGGGRRIRSWRAAGRIPARSYLQEFIEGVPGSVVFMSGAGRCVPLGITRQIIGDPAFGASGFRYCGSMLAAAGPVGAERLAAAVTEAFGLVGLNTIDFIARNGVPYPIEVNPRWSGSMELVERVVGVPLFSLHARLSASGEPPPVSLGWGRPPRGGVPGKAIVFARQDLRVGDTQPWLDDPAVRDVPQSGEWIAAGQPICTVFAEGGDTSDCHAALVRRAERIYADIASSALTR